MIVSRAVRRHRLAPPSPAAGTGGDRAAERNQIRHVRRQRRPPRIRSLLRGIAIGRSLKSESRLSSMPVVTVYGPPLLLSRVNCALRFRSAWLDTDPRHR